MIRRTILAAACAVALGAVLLGAVAPTAQAAPNKPRPCPVRAAELRNAQAVVYLREKEAGSEIDRTMIGCQRKTRKRTRLYSWSSCDCSIADSLPPQVWLAGRFVATNAFECNPSRQGECYGQLGVADLRSGRKLYQTHATRGPTGLPKFPMGPVTRLLLKRNGSVAFSHARGGFFATPRLTRIDRDGLVVLDNAVGLDPESLASDGRRLYWLRDGQPQTASFR